MTSLRQQMIDAMVLRGLAGRTQECYVAVVAQLASYYHCSPDRLDAAQVKAWLLHRISERHLAYATINQAVCAIKFLFSA
uniref:site-specific integrase n=1 Tax=Zoogloea sp. TaxID=49181 RepID=UPI0035B4BBA3